MKAGMFTGTANVAVPGGNATSLSGAERNVIGGVADFQGKGYNLHAMYLHSELDFNSTTPPIEIKSNTQTVSLGYRFEKNNFVNWTEVIYRWSASVTLHSIRSGYSLIGYRLGNWMPRYSYSTEDWSSTPGMDSFSQIHNVGFNYQLTSQAIVKVDYQYQSGRENRAPGSATRANGSTDSNLGGLCSLAWILFSSHYLG